MVGIFDVVEVPDPPDTTKLSYMVSQRPRSVGVVGVAAPAVKINSTKSSLFIH
jgi:hypothetical protein